MGAPLPSPTVFRALAPAPRRGRGAARFTALLAVAALLLLTACARPAPDQPMTVNFLPAPGELLTAAGDRLSPEAFMAKARNAAYVLIGESHGQSCDHEAERQLLTLLAHNSAGGGHGPAVGLEMVPAKNSAVLQDFVAGAIKSEELEARLDWGKTWGHPFARYLPVFLAMRDWKLPAAGLNVPPDVIRRLSTAAMDNATASDPVAALSAEDRALLPERIIEPAPEQLAFLREVMSGHPQGRNVEDSRQMARFLLIQSVWDSAMAEQAVALRTTAKRQVAVIAGTGHVDGGLGIARRIAVLDPGAEILLVSPWRGDDLDAKDAQVRVYCPLRFESRMGMVLEHRVFGEASRVLVAEVRRGSRAEAAGLRPGDVVTRAGGYRMDSLTALHLAGSDAFRAKRPLVLDIQRGQACYTVDLGPLGQQQSGQPQPAVQTATP